MRRATALDLLRRHEAEFRQIGLRHLHLFGSVARDEAGPDSDIDLFCDYEKGRFSLFDLMDAQARVSQILGCKVDLTTRDGLHAMLRPGIEAQSLRVF
ncbi:nucleotidyltransferase family protein [Siccirubricoccus phaeus]|uniref:nucleotidyltransferase family protein n=1 Tax=Siccirubricoccus phaeus TaxID=2595053 RepID=UPI0011F38833|nr:nucleotidyltransferase family protein [Siccirubricoccus phaeus]